MKSIPLPLLLSFNAGYVDTLGFLALQGLFTAHVTGNFVTLGATVAMGTSGLLPKLLALPVFCLVVLLTRMAGILLEARGLPVLRTLLAAKFVLLTAVAVFVLFHGRFGASDEGLELAIGMTLVSAMAIQNAVHRVHLAKAPPSTLMTGTTTQVMLDIADILVGKKGEDAAVIRSRLKRMIASVIVFAAGCAAGALAFIAAPVESFIVPALLAATALFATTVMPEGA